MLIQLVTDLCATRECTDDVSIAAGWAEPQSPPNSASMLLQVCPLEFQRSSLCSASFKSQDNDEARLGLYRELLHNLPYTSNAQTQCHFLAVNGRQ